MPRTALVRTIAGALVAMTPALAGAQEAKDSLVTCEKPYGTLAVVEPQQQYMYHLQRYSLGSPSALLRMMAQNSKCFLVVERGVGLQNIQQERQLARAGEMQEDANMGGGQMKAADFVLTPQVQISEPNAGGVGGVVGGVLGRRNPVIGVLGAGVKFKEAETTLLVADARTTVQVAAAGGKARKSNFSIGALGWAGAAMGIGAYSNTAEGKVIASSFLDNYNKLIAQIKQDEGMTQRAANFKPGAISGADTKGGASFSEGDVLRPKIDNVKLQAEPADAAKTVTTLKKADELVYLGEEKDGYVKVQGSSGEGWVKKTLVTK